MKMFVWKSIIVYVIRKSGKLYLCTLFKNIKIDLCTLLERVENYIYVRYLKSYKNRLLYTVRKSRKVYLCTY